MPSYDARFIPTGIPNAPVREREHCVAHRNQITTIGRNKGQQVRVKRFDPDGTESPDFALYTVIDVHDEEPNVVFVRYRDPESKHHDLKDRLGLSGPDPFTGKIDSQVTDDSEYVEHLTDNGRHRGLIVIAPHGGNIERHTDEQAERVGEQLASKCVSVWVCKGFKKGGGAYDRWHITSIDIGVDSFPKLKTVSERNFEYAVAFHGWDEDSICIGGSAPPDLKRQIKIEVLDAVAGKIEVFTDDEGKCPEGFTGTDPKNIVNRLAKNGIQLEQSKDARDKFSLQIADAVARVIGPKIEVCTAPVFEGSDSWTCLMTGIGDGVQAISRGGVSCIPCQIKRLLFRIRNCRRGNTDPCIEL